AGAAGVVARELEELDGRQLAGLLVAGELALPLGEADLVRDRHVETGVVVVGVRVQVRLVVDRYRRRVRGPETVVAVAEALAVQAVPDVGVLRVLAGRAALADVEVPAAAVERRLGLHVEGAGVGGGGPLPAVVG